MGCGVNLDKSCTLTVTWFLCLSQGNDGACLLSKTPSDIYQKDTIPSWAENIV